MERNLAELDAVGIKHVPNSLISANQCGIGKGNDNKKNNIGHVVDGDEDYVPCDDEERLSSNSDNDDPSGSQANKVKGTGPKNFGNPEGPTQSLKRKRGPTKLKTIAVDEGSKIEVIFDENGQPIGEGSVKLSSFLGPLVREIVPYTLSDWRKLPQGMAEVLWQSIQVRFNLHEQWHREMVFKRMNEVWRASKSTLVSKVRNASNEEERLKLQPNNVKSLHEWKGFVKEKTSVEFKVKSDNFKEMRKKQMELQHTMSRKGYARLTAELKAKRKVASISRVDVWTNGHTNRSSQPANKNIAQKIEDMQKIQQNKTNSSSTNPKEDALSQVLGAEKHGRLRAFGKGVTMTRLNILAQMNGQFHQLHEENVQLKSQMAHVLNMVDELKKTQNPKMMEATPTTPIVSLSVQSPSQNPPQINTKCKLLHWMGTGEVVAEGRWFSSDPIALVHFIPIGPGAMKVWVDVAKKPNEFLWRTTSEATFIEEALGTPVAWPADKVIMDSLPRSMG